ERAFAEHRLAVLVGRMPDLHFAGRPPEEFDLPPRIPIGVPADLLARRPDVRAAELRLVASNARIGAAIPEVLPQFSITGVFGNATIIDLSKISRAASNFFIVGPAVRLPIFQGGLTYARLLGARAQNSVDESEYRQAVLNAFGEVANYVIAI